MTDHKVTYQQDTKYDHLFRPICSCGWHKSGFCGKDLATDYATKHLQSIIFDGLEDDLTK